MDIREINDTRSKGDDFKDGRWGTYWHDSQDAELYLKGLTSEESKYVAMHEVAHYFWFEKLTFNQRGAYRRVFNNATDYVSEYAKTNAREDFAETYAKTIQCEFNINLMPNDRAEILYLFAEDR